MEPTVPGTRKTTRYANRRIRGKAGMILAAIAILGTGCAQPVPFDNCTFDPARVRVDMPPEDFRIAVLAPPPRRSAPDPRIEVEIRPSAGEPQTYLLELTRLDDDPRMVTRETQRTVDYWQRFALTESSYDDYRNYRAQLAAPAGGVAQVESTAWLVRSPIVPAGRTVSELRVRTNDAVGYDAICRP